MTTLTMDMVRRALSTEQPPMPAKPLFVVPSCLEQAAREAFGSAVEISVIERISQYDDHLLRRKKPQPNPKPR